MAAQYTCDGCDKPLRERPKPAFVVVTYDTGLIFGNALKEFDLCQGCQECLQQQADPRKWPRDRIEPSAAKPEQNVHAWHEW
jgi:hypothetical protein